MVGDVTAESLEQIPAAPSLKYNTLFHRFYSKKWIAGDFATETRVQIPPPAPSLSHTFDNLQE
jgi:hypothetical protein